MAFPAWAGELGTSAVQILAMGYFESHANSSIDEFLTQTRPAPLTRADCDEVIASLPKDGELQAKPAELTKIDAARSVIQYHQRAGVVMVIRRIRRFGRARNRARLHVAGIPKRYESQGLQEDAGTRATVRRDCRADLACVGIDPENLVSAIQKVTRFNQLRDTVASSARYVSLKERVRFIRTIAALGWN